MLLLLPLLHSSWFLASLSNAYRVVARFCQSSVSLQLLIVAFSLLPLGSFYRKFGISLGAFDFFPALLAPFLISFKFRVTSGEQQRGPFPSDPACPSMLLSVLYLSSPSVFSDILFYHP